MSSSILFNGNITTSLKPQSEIKPFLMDLAEVKQVNYDDLKAFLAEDHTSFSVLNVMLKSILSTGRTSVTLSKNSARSFYSKKPKLSLSEKVNIVEKKLKDDCLKDAQNCDYFQFFNRKEKRLYIRFLDKVEANFEGTAAQQLSLFLTLTFNTKKDNLFAFTTNWDPTDDCWNILQGKGKYDLKNWARFFDPNCEPKKILLSKLSPEEVSDFNKASQYVSKFLRDIRLKWKPKNWKWVVVAELQKKGIWHFHLISTPIVPYSHKCRLDRNFASCWNCRTYISELWPYGRVESRSPGKKPLGQYLAKYLAKSFHLRKLYREHGFSEHNKAYRFFKNLYDYEEREAILIGKSKIDQLTGQKLNGNQHIFRRADNSHFYRTNEQQVGTVTQPFRISKNYRLGTRTLNPLNLLELAKQSRKKEVIKLRKSLLKRKIYTRDFQEFLITKLLNLCQKAEFVKMPLEQEQVPKENGQCNKSVVAHFQTKPVLHFTFAPEKAVMVREFAEKLDDYAEEYDMEEGKNFIFYPTAESKELWTPQQARNCYLDNWWVDYGRTSPYQPTPGSY